MNIKPCPPPNWTQIQLYQNSHKYNPPKGSVFSFNDIIYNPDNGYIDVPTYAHETLHIKQQKELGSSVWWDKYLSDKKFRFSKELPAYQVQYATVRTFVKDEKRLERIAKTFAKEITTLFKGLVSKEEALKAIRSKGLAEVSFTEPDNEVPKSLTDFRFQKDVNYEDGV